MRERICSKMSHRHVVFPRANQEMVGTRKIRLTRARHTERLCKKIQTYREAGVVREMPPTPTSTSGIMTRSLGLGGDKFAAEMAFQVPQAQNRGYARLQAMQGVTAHCAFSSHFPPGSYPRWRIFAPTSSEARPSKATTLILKSQGTHRVTRAQNYGC